MITVLAGGTGSVKLVRGLAALTEDIAVVCNVGDNIWLHGLYVCPDIDTITYGLAGLLDEKRGWGVKGDSFECLSLLKELGAPDGWFGLGDRDLATHLVRTRMMVQEGRTLSEVTECLRKRHSIAAQVIPATDQQVTTKIATGAGKEMHLQEFWVKCSGSPRVTGVRYEGAVRARASRRAIDAIRRADAVVIAPANPISSIGPIVALAGLRKELQKKRKNVIAVSPLIGEQAISGPAVKYMKALGLENSPAGVALHYRDFAGNFVMSSSDHRMAPRIQSLGMCVFETNITMKNRRDEIRLGRYLLEIRFGNN